MCFICNQQKGFETDIAQIIKLNQNQNLKLSAKKQSLKSSDLPINDNNFDIVSLNKTLSASELNQQTYSNSGQTKKIISNSGIDHIDSLFNDEFSGPRKWNSDPFLNNTYSQNGSTVISYSIPPALGLVSENHQFGNGDFTYNNIAFTTTQKDEIRLAFKDLEKFINVDFVEVEEIGNKVGSIRIFINDLYSNYDGLTSGDAVGDQPGESPQAGDVIFSERFSKESFSSGLVKETDIYTPYNILIHEIQHTLGIEHPGDHRTIPFPASKFYSNYSVMSGEVYNEHSKYIDNGIEYAVSYGSMVYDIAAIQYLYGANTKYNSGDTNYSFNANQPFIESIWDASGIDTFDFSSFTKNQIINMNDGAYSTIDFNVNWKLTDNLGIAFNAIIENAKGGSGADKITGNKYKNNIQGNAGDDAIDGGSDYDIATYSGNFSDYTFTIANNKVMVKDNRSSTNDGTDTLSNIEKLTFADKNALITSKEIKPIYSLGFQSEKVYSGTSNTYKFYDLGNEKYGIETVNGIDSLTGQSLLKFDDKNLNLATDIKGTFDQVTGLNTDSGEMFRLYNAAFARFPDADGLKYWIDQFSSGKNTRRVVAQSFLGSAEFTEKYGSNVSDETYVNNLYKNVLGRDADTEGLNYWVGNLSSGVETRYEALLGFAESAENKALFTDMTGFG